MANEKRAPVAKAPVAAQPKGSVPNYMMNAERLLRRIEHQENPNGYQSRLRADEQGSRRSLPVRRWGPSVCALLCRDGRFASPPMVGLRVLPGGSMVQFDQRFKRVRQGHAEYRAATVQV